MTQKRTKEELTALLRLEQFPRSAGYDVEWVLDNLMGPNVLWLAEAMSQVMDLQPGMRVLDMGCGRAVSSIFLAQEFGVQVWATDLWIAATDNWQRICAAGLQDRITPIHAEAHALPFADGFFDAAISLDAYHYFGTADLYLGYYSRFLRTGGQIGILVPGLRQEFAEGLPEHLAPYWEWDFWSFHSPEWWRGLWERTGFVEVAVADLVPNGWKQWLLWLEVCAEQGARSEPRQTEMVRTDAGRTLGFSRLLAHKR